MSERRAYEALSSQSRLEILKLLHKKPLGVEEIAKQVNLQPVTVRQHLASLIEAGFIESYTDKKMVAGRPKIYYKIAKEPTVVGYPKRHYQTLSGFTIRTLQTLIGTKRTAGIFKRVGKNMGENAIRQIALKHEIENWSLEAVKKFFLREYLEGAGAEPEIVKEDKNEVVYRMHNCLFLELAVKMPEMMCDVVHEAFHEGVTSAMDGKAKIVRVTCKGQGDSYCEHRFEWRESRDEK